MRNIPVMDCGDGFTRANNGCFGKGPVIKTAAYTISVRETGTVFSNKGDGDALVLTLPAAEAGVWFTFFKHTQQNLSVQAAGGAKINNGTANKKYENVAAEAGGSCTLVSDGVDWFVAGEKGTWVNNNT